MIKPLRKNVIIEELNTENVSSAGIILQGKRTDVKHSRVLAVGDSVTEVKVDDVVVVDWQFASKSSYKDKPFFVISEEHVIAVVEQ
jgi:co-chaperonin GroES (HSP10)